MRIVACACGLSFACLLSITAAAAAESSAPSRPIFDGQSLANWKGDKDFWRIEDGVLVGESTAERPLGQNTFLVWEDGEVDDFELTLKYRISGAPSANSGIQFRGRQRDDGRVIGYQADIDLAGKYVGTLYDEERRGPLAGRGERVRYSPEGQREITAFADAADLLQSIPLDDWNEYRILARGNRIEIWMNGQKTAEFTDDDPRGMDRSGLLALQLHSGPPMKIEFRDIQLRRLPLENGWKKVVFVAGSRSHGYFAHEHHAGCQLLASRLNQAQQEQGLPVIATVYANGWPRDPGAFDNANTVVSYCDGGPRHYLNDHLEEFDSLVQTRGVGLVCLHYGVETVPGDPGDHFLKWIGGFFEPHWSVNPHWSARFETLPEHPITRGVEPFEILDEWYYHMRFVPGMEGVTPILTALPPRESLNRQDGPHSGNPHVRAAVLERAEPQHVAWAYERPDGKGRGFGFTGGHFHRNWEHDGFRKTVLNAIAWTAGLEIPEQGIASERPGLKELENYQDFPKPEGFQLTPIQQSKRPVDPLHDPANAVSQLKVHPELEVTLFASEPMFSNPSSIDVDHLGRVWVCEAANYRAFRNADVIGTNRPADRILILEDTNGDGAADRLHEFYQGNDVNSAHGILVLPTPDGTGLRALVSAQESIFYLIDEDGDLRADRKELLFTGIQGSEHDHGIHACHFGPDGRLYFNFGNAGKRILDHQGKPIVDRAGNAVNDSRNPYQEGMVFRCRLDGSELETLGWNFRNNWELCVDSFGNIWQSDNDDDGNRGVRINFVMEYGNYGYRDELTGAGWNIPRTGWSESIPHRHWHLNDPGVIPNLLLTGAGAPSGICFYEGDALPGEFQNAILHCDPGVNVCRAYRPIAEGAGYRAEVINLLEGSKNPHFRPCDVCVAPDGSLYVADWYDPGVGGHRMQTPDQGRILHLTAKGSSGSQRTCDVSTIAGAIEALQSANMSVRYLGWTALQQQGIAAEPELRAVWNSDDPRFRARALWLLGQLPLEPSAREELLLAALADADENIRCTAIRLIRMTDRAGPVANEHAILSPDAPAGVRREALIALREAFRNTEDSSRHKELASSWAALARTYSPGDRWLLEALGLAAHGNWDDCLTAYLSGIGDDWKADPAARDIVWRSRSAQTPHLLVELISDPATAAAELPRYFRALDFQQAAPKQEAVSELAFSSLEQLAEDEPRMTMVRSEAFNRLEANSSITSAAEKNSLEELLGQTVGTAQFVRLVYRFQLEDRYPQLLDLARSQPNSQMAVEAIRVLMQRKQQNLIRAALASDDRDAVEQLLTALQTAGDRSSMGILLEILQDNERPLWLRRGAIKAIGGSVAGALKLVEIAQAAQYDPALKPALAATLAGVPWSGVRDQAVKVFPPAPGRDEQPLPPISELIQRKGDATRGAVVFNTTGNCQKCHRVNGIGLEVGPDLSEIGKKLAKAALYESILFPSAAISHGYEAWVIYTDEGQIYSGLIVSETDQEIQLKDDKGILRMIPTPSIEERRKQDVSLMPADLQKLMSEQELIDVVEYLVTLQNRRL